MREEANGWRLKNVRVSKARDEISFSSFSSGVIYLLPLQ